MTFYDAPVTMRLTVFLSFSNTQIHATYFWRIVPSIKGAGRHYNAFDYDLGDGRTIRLCSADDLIIHKALAGRPQDETDIEGVILRQRHHLDVSYIRRWLRAFADLLETPEVLQRFEIPWRQST